MTRVRILPLEHLKPALQNATGVIEEQVAGPEKRSLL